MYKHIKIIACALATIGTVNAEINRRVFDIDEFRANLFQYFTDHHKNLMQNCTSMLDKLAGDVPSQLQATYDSIKSITRNVFDTADILYVQKPSPQLVKKSVDDLLKQKSSAKRSFFGTKFTQGVKGIFTKKDDKKIAYNELKKLFDAIFDVLSSAIDRIKDDSKTYKPLLKNKAENLRQQSDEINPSWR